MAELIFNSLVEGFAYSKTTAAGEDLYKAEISTGAPAITAGETYTVILDGLQYVCAAQEDTIGGESGVVVGNPTITDSGGTNTGEPFLYMYNATAGTGSITTLFTETKHNVELYAGLVENESNVIIAERVYTFNKETEGNLYTTGVNNVTLEAGAVYTVFWDGTRRVCTAKTATVYGTDAVVIGDQSIDAELFPDGEDTDEEFLLGYVAAYSMTVFETLETDRTHTVAIYKGEVEEDSGGEVGKVILENRTVAYSADDGCWIAMNDEGTGPYLTDGLFSLTEGKTYTIVINGVEYVGEASKATVAGLGEVIGIGNGDALAGGEGNGEPYAAGFAQAGANASTFVFFWFDTDTRADTYTVSLYEGDITSGGGGTEDGYLLKDAELAFELETNSETHYFNNEAVVAISVGKTYTVIWDGSYYDCTAKEYTAVDEDTTITLVALGNLNIRDSEEENTLEPFVYLYLKLDGASGASFITMETDASHVISIYDGVLEHPAVTYADIYTYDKDGNAVLHEKRSSVTFDTPDGRYAVFKLSHIADSRS